MLASCFMVLSNHQDFFRWKRLSLTNQRYIICLKPDLSVFRLMTQLFPVSPGHRGSVSPQVASLLRDHMDTGGGSMHPCGIGRMTSGILIQMFQLLPAHGGLPLLQSMGRGYLLLLHPVPFSFLCPPPAQGWRNPSCVEILPFAIFTPVLAQDLPHGYSFQALLPDM